MNRNFKQGSFFAKAEGEPKSWKDRFAKLTGKKPAAKSAEAKLEIQDATGETLIFPEIGDVSEIVEKVKVTATDGDHVFTVDNSVYTVSVLAGEVTSVIEDQTGTDEDGEPLSEETMAFVEAVIEEQEVNATFREDAQRDIDDLRTKLATALGELSKLKGLMKHGDDGLEGEEEEKPLTIAGKKIDLKKINFNKK